MAKVPTARNSSTAYSRQRTDAGVASSSYTGGPMPTSVRLRAGKKGAMGGTGGQARVPVWSVVPDGAVADTTLPVTVDLNPYVSGGPLYGWSLSGAPAGITISGQGVVTVAAGTAQAAYPMTASVFGPDGEATSATFTWTVAAAPTPPVWSVVDDVSFDDVDLPETYDITSYVTSSVLAPITGYSMGASNPAGFSVDDDGILEVAGSVAPGVHVVSIVAENSEGTAESAPFNVTVVDV